MGFDFNNFFNKAKNIAVSVGSKAVNTMDEIRKEYVPSKFNPEKKYVNAIVSSMALMVFADRKVEQEEVEVVLDTINNDPVFKETNMVKEAIDLYTMHISTLTDANNKGNADYALSTLQIMQDIALVTDPQKKQNIVDLSMKISASDGDIDEEELKVLNKIKETLGL